MRPFLILAPYILIPLVLTLILKKFKIFHKNWNYLITGVLVILYPMFLFWLDNLINPPPGPRCGTPQLAFFVGSLIYCLPTSLILQFIFNRIFLRNSQSKEDDTEI